MRQEIIGEERAGESGDDHDLLHAREAAAHARRRHFADVGGRQDARGAQPRRRRRSAPRSSSAQSAAAPEASALKMNKRGRHEHHAPAAQAIRRTPGDERADRAARQQGADRDAEPRSLKLNVL